MYFPIRGGIITFIAGWKWLGAAAVAAAPHPALRGDDGDVHAGGYLETLLAAHPGRLLQIAEICSTTGTSAFILKRCCWNALGMSPGRYLSLRRLKLVRLALQNADPATTAVVEVLRECGYSASQRYVAEYRSVFGSVPFTNLGSAGARRFGIGGDGAFPA